ncbi:SH3 domain-containing protein [Roseomonas sp. KE0001]|uniref:SH3 domain-containing protein n=1 Tax=Roseomonas sp. KE0001 TaxID=2479201 RepID=UPI0018DFA21D|nr:SH3 domain-containing protein [Roseomonas sp. KE0001]
MIRLRPAASALLLLLVSTPLAAQSSLGGAQGTGGGSGGPGTLQPPRPAQPAPLRPAPDQVLRPPAGAAPQGSATRPATPPATRPAPARPVPEARPAQPNRPQATPTPRRAPPTQAAPPTPVKRPPAARAAGAAAGVAAGAAATGAAGSAPPPPASPAPSPQELQQPSLGSATGLPIPRFVSLRSDEVNLRIGPDTRFPIEWTYQRRDLPVEILREYNQWRRIRDMDGTEGWVHQSTLAGRRTFLVRGEERSLHSAEGEASAVVARLMPGVVGRIRSCKAGSNWCEVQVEGHRGYIQRSAIWGLQAGEEVN